MPSWLVIQLFSPIAQSRRNCGDQQMLVQPMSAVEARLVQVIPSGLVMTRKPLSPLRTTQNRRNSGDQQIELATILTIPETLRKVHCRPVPSHGVPPHPRAAGKVTLALSSTEPRHESPHALALATSGVNDRCGQE